LSVLLVALLRPGPAQAPIATFVVRLEQAGADGLLEGGIVEQD